MGKWPAAGWAIIEMIAFAPSHQNGGPTSDCAGRCLGAQAGEAILRSVVGEGGFGGFRGGAETPFNLIFEATP